MVTTGTKGDNGAQPDSIGDALERVHAALAASPAFYGHGTDNPWDEAVQLLLAALERPLDAGEELLVEPLSVQGWKAVRDLLTARLERREPLPYLTGRAYFAGLEFRCDPRALVPRSPLAELIVEGYRPWWQGPPPERILDLCCGGGSIGIAAARFQPRARVTLADIDADALALAGENVALHAVGERVRCVRSDLFAALDRQRYELILCNPPYVDAADIAAMPAEFRREPRLGLSAGDDGLDLALRILAEASDWLTDSGLLLLELGNSWEALEARCQSPPLTWAEFACGGHGVLVAQRSELLSSQSRFREWALERVQRSV